MKLLQVGATWLSQRFSELERYYSKLVPRLPRFRTEVTPFAYELKDFPSTCGPRQSLLKAKTKAFCVNSSISDDC